MHLDEFLARCLAARKLSLIEDPHGLRLPFDLWRQALPEAEFIISALIVFDQMEVVAAYHQEAEEGE